MRFGISTNWSALRHESGEALVDEILELGFDALELGYHTTEELAVGIRSRVEQGVISVDSVHAYCPVPIGAPHGYPELYLLASTDDDERAMARILLGKTLDFAVSMGARAVVLHAGRIPLKTVFRDFGTGRLVAVRREGGDLQCATYQRLLAKALRLRTKRVSSIFDGFCCSLETLLPRFEKANVTLCLENLPSLEAFPNEQEMLLLNEHFNTPALGYWHDMGHGQIRENLEWIRHVDAVQSLLPVTRGVHIHDVCSLLDDHAAPGEGMIDFASFACFAPDHILKVFEPAPDVSADLLRTGLSLVKRAWSV